MFVGLTINFKYSVVIRILKINAAESELNNLSHPWVSACMSSYIGYFAHLNSEGHGAESVSIRIPQMEGKVRIIQIQMLEINQYSISIGVSQFVQCLLYIQYCTRHAYFYTRSILYRAQMCFLQPTTYALKIGKISPQPRLYCK